MTKLPNTTKIINEINDGWLTIWFNSPSNRNALSEALTQDFTATLEAVKDDRSICLLYTSPSPRDQRGSRMPSSA